MHMNVSESALILNCFCKKSYMKPFNDSQYDLKTKSILLKIIFYQFDTFIFIFLKHKIQLTLKQISI